MKELKSIFYILWICALIGCSRSSDSETQEPIITPEVTSLVFPNNNSLCNEGSIISNTESSVLFKWNTSNNTDSYEVNLINLTTNNAKKYSANTNQLAITIQRGTSYSWSVASKSNNTSDTAESPIWKFYNAGLPVENYTPFPADIISPVMGTSIVSGTITLQWNGNDIDNDIVSYDIYMDTKTPPITKIGNTTENTISTTVNSGETYYWKVITFDSAENTSTSEIFQFKVN